MATKKRVVVPRGPGSAGDLPDRFRDVYKPGARSAPKPGLVSPAEAIRRLRKRAEPRKR